MPNCVPKLVTICSEYLEKCVSIMYDSDLIVIAGCCCRSRRCLRHLNCRTLFSMHLQCLRNFLSLLQYVAYLLLSLPRCLIWWAKVNF